MACKIFLVKQMPLDDVLPRDRLSVRDNAHGVVSIAEHTVDVTNHGSNVLLALAVVGHEELVRGVDGEVPTQLGGGGGIAAAAALSFLVGLFVVGRCLIRLGGMVAKLSSSGAVSLVTVVLVTASESSSSSSMPSSLPASSSSKEKDGGGGRK